MNEDEIMETVMRVLEHAMKGYLADITWGNGVLAFACFFIWCWQPETAYIKDGEFHYAMAYQSPGWIDNTTITIEVTK